MKIKKVEIEAFRAYKSKLDGNFDFTNNGDVPSNFVAIYAPNGFGKSSFYDAVEWAVTNHLERLGGDHNKSNYENAAKGTKEQKILRNKHVGENVTTKVVVSTTRQEPFERQLPKIRSNGRDYNFNNKNQRVNDFFRSVILSQDEVDRFLREAKPQERYSKFMDSFGGEIEIARKELSALISDNETELNSLKKKREFLIEELKKPIDLSVFELFNSVAAELNTAGENIVLPDEKFSAQTEHQLNAQLTARQHEINMLQQEKIKISEALLERLIKIPEIELHFVSLAEQNEQLIKLTNGVANADKYQGLLDSYEKCVADHKNVHTRFTQLVDIAEKIDAFLSAELRLTELSSRQKALSKDRSKNSEVLARLEIELTELGVELKTLDDSSLQLKNLVENSGPVYTAQSNHRSRYNLLAKQISDKKLTIQLENAQLEQLNRELNALSALKITTNSLLAGDIGVLAFEQAKIVQLTRCNADLDLIESSGQVMRSTQKALADQMNLHEQLIAIGLDFLSSQPSNICPLCTTSHPSEEALMSKIKDQNLLSELSKDNAKKLSDLSLRQKELTDTIKNITNQAIEAQAEQLNRLHVKRSEVADRLSHAEREKSALEAEYKSIEKIISELENAVLGLPNDELISRVDSELKDLSLRRQSLIEQQKTVTSKVLSLRNLVKTIDVDLQLCTSESQIISSETSYVTVLDYLNKNAVVSAELKIHCLNKKNELEVELKAFEISIKNLAEQCNVLHKQMIDDGTWVNFSLLKNQKEGMEVSIARSQSAIGAFYDGLSKIIDISSDKPLTIVKEILESTIVNLKIDAKRLNDLSDRIHLLLELMKSFKPYVSRIKLQEDMSEIEVQIGLRNRVSETLASEMIAIVEHLKSLINNFFYEDLINSIYRKIDPHPEFKKVEFKADFESEKPGLNIVVSDVDGEVISPILYFSAAQTNILSLSVFLANALHAKDDNGNPVDVILIDDPIQSMDSINILSTIDLLRSICLQFNKQIIISTHDENFFGLLQRKIPTQVMGSKFLKLERFGVVVPVEPFNN